MTTGGRRVADEWYAEEVLVVAPPPGVRLLPMARRPAIRDEEIREEEEDVAAIAAIASVVMQNGMLVLLSMQSIGLPIGTFVMAMAFAWHHGFLQACWELLSDVIDESLCIIDKKSYTESNAERPTPFCPRSSKRCQQLASGLV